MSLSALARLAECSAHRENTTERFENGRGCRVADQLRQPARYRPSVNVARAPQASVPLPFLAGGWVWLLWALGQLASARGFVAARDWGAPALIAAVHGVTLGFLTLTMMGFLYQWVPVVFDVPALPRWFSWSEGGVYAAGLVLFEEGWLRSRLPLLAVGGALLSLALLALASGIAARVASSRRPWDTVSTGVVLALLGLTATWLLGFRMAWTIAHGQSPNQWLALHIAVALVAWVATLVSAVQLKLAPMFAMARVHGALAALPTAALWVGLSLEGASVLARLPWAADVAAACWLAASALAMGLIMHLRRGGRAPRRDTVLAAALAGWGLWAGAAVMLPWAPPVSVVLGLGGAAAMVLGYQSRLAPFFLALVTARRSAAVDRAFFLARAMSSALAPRVAAAACAAGALLVAAGAAWHQADWVGAAAAVMGLGWARVVGSMVGQARRARRAAPAPRPPEPPSPPA